MAKKSSHRSAGEEIAHDLKDVATEGHKVARATRKADSTVYMAEVLASGNPRRIRRYFFRKLAYKLFGKFMGKTINRL